MRSSQVLKEDGSKCGGLLELHKTPSAQRRDVGSGPRFPARDMDPAEEHHLGTSHHQTLAF